MERITVAIGSAARLTWVDEQTLLDADVQPWGELPLWVAAPELAGLLEADVTRGLAAGLTLRPLEETAIDTLAWSRTAGEQRPALTRERERAILERAGLAV